MNRRVKSAALWGAVGALTFLVLAQGYALLVEPLVSMVGVAVVALLVAFVTGAATYALEYRVARWAARRAGD